MGKRLFGVGPVAGALAVALSSSVSFSGVAHAEPDKLQVQEVAETGSMPKGALLSKDGTKFYVTNFGQLDKRNVTIYDAKTLKPEGDIDLPGVVVESALSHDGKTLFVSNFRRSSVMYIDLASRTMTREIKTGAHPKVLAVSGDGKSLFTANWATNDVTQIDVGSGDVVRTLKVGKQPRGMVAAKNGRLYVANFYGDSIDVFDGKELDQRHRLSVCKCPRHLALSPDEKTIYISCLNGDQVHALDLATETVTHKVPVGNAPKTVAVSPDGRWVYTADYGESRSISVVDTSDWTSRIFPIAAMDRGSGVAVAPDGKHAIVTGWYDGHVYLVGFEGSGGHPEETKKAMYKWQFRPKHDEPGAT